MTLKRSKSYTINDWDRWVELCSERDINPREEVEFGLDIGGGDSIDFEYIGEIPTED